jgi:Fe-S-cluster containining protein
MGDRCTGHCCKEFVLSSSYENVRRSYEAHQRGEDKYLSVESEKEIAKAGGNYDVPSWMTYHSPDIATVFPMLVPLGIRTHDRETGRELSRPSEIFTCRHLQTNGDCGIYEKRPDMCSSYPGKYGCHFSECEWDAARPPEKDALATVRDAVTEELVQLRTKLTECRNTSTKSQ